MLGVTGVALSGVSFSSTGRALSTGSNDEYGSVLPITVGELKNTASIELTICGRLVEFVKSLMMGFRIC